jgi:aromatic-L-amino-acid decarboxylase
MILPGGSHATLQALHVAKGALLADWLRRGPATIDAQPRIYFSTATHFSVDRAARVIGLGDDCIAPIGVTGRGAMDAAELEETIRRDVQRGMRPFVVVATAGTTGTGAIDPLDVIATICRENQVWLHVDACYGGAMALVDAYRDRFQGLLRADSICIDLHKWLFMPLTAGVLLTRHDETVKTLFDVSASYIPDGSFTEAYCRGLPTSRRATGLAVWFGMRSAGWKTIENAIIRNIQLTRRLEARLRDAGFRVLDDGELSIACARWEPEHMDPDAKDQLQQDISEEVRRTGQAWFATTLHDDQVWLRFNMVNLHSREVHVDRLSELVAETARRLSS